MFVSGWGFVVENDEDGLVGDAQRDRFLCTVLLAFQQAHYRNHANKQHSNDGRRGGKELDLPDQTPAVNHALVTGRAGHQLSTGKHPSTVGTL